MDSESTYSTVSHSEDSVIQWEVFSETDPPLAAGRGRLYLRVPGDGDNRTARPVPGQEMCRPKKSRGKTCDTCYFFGMM